MDFFDIRTGDENQPMLTWLMGVDTNLRLLGVFLKIYAEELGTNAAVIDLHFNAFETKLNMIKTKSTPMLFASLRVPAESA